MPTLKNNIIGYLLYCLIAFPSYCLVCFLSVGTYFEPYMIVGLYAFIVAAYPFGGQSWGRSLDGYSFVLVTIAFIVSLAGLSSLMPYVDIAPDKQAPIKLLPVMASLGVVIIICYVSILIAEKLYPEWTEKYHKNRISD